MKKTELSKVYCRPTSEEWTPEMEKLINPFNGNDICGVGMFSRKDRTEIPVDRFIDLLEDRIVGWRLKEIGFQMGVSYDRLSVNDFTELLVDYGGSVVLSIEQFCSDNLNITTFTELETLLRFLKPKQ